MLYFAGQNVLYYLYPGKILPFCRSDRAGQFVVLPANHRPSGRSGGDPYRTKKDPPERGEERTPAFRGTSSQCEQQPPGPGSQREAPQGAEGEEQTPPAAVPGPHPRDADLSGHHGGQPADGGHGLLRGAGHGQRRRPAGSGQHRAEPVQHGGGHRPRHRGTGGIRHPAFLQQPPCLGRPGADPHQPTVCVHLHRGQRFLQ